MPGAPTRRGLQRGLGTAQPFERVNDALSPRHPEPPLQWGHGVRVRLQSSTSGLPRPIDRQLIWYAIEAGLEGALADAIWTSDIVIDQGVPATEVGDPLTLLRELQGPWGQRVAERIC